MDWWLAVLVGIFVLAVVFIFIVLATLPPLGDERKTFIKMKAQSFTFSVIIVWLLFEVLQSVYLAIWSDQVAKGLNPFVFLFTISIVYLASLLFVKKKYGG